MAKNYVTAKDMQKENVKMALQVWGRTILAAVLCFFVYMSISVIANGLSTKEIGYQIYELDSSNNKVILETHLYADESSEPETPQKPVGPNQPNQADPAPETQGTAAAETTLPSGQYRETIRSEPSAGAMATANVISTVFMLILLAAFPYAIVWSKGDRDKNNVNFGHMPEDKLRGLKVGLMSAIPAALGYVFLLVSKLSSVLPQYILIYRLINVPFMPIINAMTGTATSIAQVSWPAILGMLVTVVFVPAVCHIGYTLGYKQISLSEKFIYVNSDKKKKRRR